jgi:predicted RNase H-like HicB family nuclease
MFSSSTIAAIRISPFCILVAIIISKFVIMKAKLNLNAVFEECVEGGYIAYIEELPGVNSQGETLDEAKANLLEALDLIMETQRDLSKKELGNKKVIKEPLQLAS